MQIFEELRRRVMLLFRRRQFESDLEEASVVFRNASDDNFD